MIVAICRRLDGIPLAIELAAARAAALGTDELAARLDDRFRILTGGRRTALPRHQTLQATLDWSYELLTEPERLVLRRLGVFAGAFSLEAAGPVVADPDLAPSQVVDTLASLVTKSLVQAEFGVIARYRLLDTTRTYALEQLEKSGELPAVRRRHALFFRDLLEAAFTGQAEDDSAGAFPAEIDNLRAALAWAFSPAGDAAVGTALAAVSEPTWLELSLLAECREWMERAVEVLPPEWRDTRREMALQLALGYSTMMTQGLVDDAKTALGCAYDLGRALDDLDYQLRASVGLLIFSRMSANFVRAASLSREVDVIAAQIATPLALATADGHLASTLLWGGEYVQARVRAERGAAQNSPELRRAHLVRYGYDHWMHSRALLARILWVQGFSEQSLRLTRDLVTEAEQTLRPVTPAYVLTTSGCFVALRVGDLELAEYCIDRLKAHTEMHGLRNYHAAALGFEGQLYATRGDAAAGERLLRRCIAELRETGFVAFYAEFLAHLAGC